VIVAEKIQYRAGSLLLPGCTELVKYSGHWCMANAQTRQFIVYHDAIGLTLTIAHILQCSSGYCCC